MQLFGGLVVVILFSFSLRVKMIGFTNFPKDTKTSYDIADPWIYIVTSGYGLQN